ncbi:MAG: TonB-dependent receptor [Opitutaceae bacterium]|nr:TonB-dependent receptor [Opitutaceae bacterium]
MDARALAGLGAGDIASALRLVPGVTFSRFNRVGSYGGDGGGAVFARGLGASRPGGELTALCDGAPRFNAVFGHPLPDILPTDAAGAVRVFKGVSPLDFGNAFAAVEIVPADAGAEGFSATLAGGGDGTLVERAEVTAREGGLGVRAGQGLRRSDGHRANSGGRTADAFVRLSWRLGGVWRLSFFGDRTQNRAEDPGVAGQPFHQGNYRTEDWFATLTLENRGGRARGFAKLYLNDGRAAWLDQGMRGSGAVPAATAADTTTMDWRLWGLRAREAIALGEGGVLTAGADVDTQEGAAVFTTYGAGERRFGREVFRLLSPYAGLRQAFAGGAGWRAEAEAGARFYTHNIFGAEWSPFAKVTAVFRGLEAGLSRARGVAYPGMNVAVFSSGILIPTLSNAGWRGLDAETLTHTELSLARRFGGRLRVEAAVFRDDGRDRYIMVAERPGPPTRFENIGAWRNRGAELAAAWRAPGGLEVFAGGAWLESSVAGLPYAPEWSACGGLSWEAGGGLRVSADFSWRDTMFADTRTRTAADAAGNPRVGAAFLVNARVSLALGRAAGRGWRGELFASVENLTDRTYEYRPGYPMPGIGWLAGARMGW